MGLRCRVMGHVHETTEFEERRAERGGEAVLICREYQVCSRCGDRDELYRNEQVLSSSMAEADTDGLDPSEKESATEPAMGSPDIEVSPDSSGEETDIDSNEQSHGAETESASVEESSDRDWSDGQVYSDDDGDSAKDESLTAVEVAKKLKSETADEESVIVESESPDSTPDTATADSSGSGDENKREISKMALSEEETTGNRLSETEGTSEPSGQDQAPSEVTEDERPTEDAVILTDSSPEAKSSPGEDEKREPTSTGDQQDADRETTPARVAFGNEDDGGDGIGCPACGGEWERDATSLRDGDICPECRQGYIESR